MKKILLILIFSLIFFSCEKELDISDFSDDYSFYEPELRIEAIIYPTENSALVRIDQSVRIDEADLYNCEDDDNDWNYYYSAMLDSSYESLVECENSSLDGTDCTLHLYECVDFFTEEEQPLWTFIDREACEAACLDYCVTDDTGSDGMLSQLEGEDPGFIEPDEDGSENNSQPDCGEMNVDEFNEILPDIHVSECETKIINNDLECPLYFHEQAGKFYNYKGRRSGGDFDVINYGGFIPDTTICSDNFFQNYDTEYQLVIECPENSPFFRYGRITAVDTIRKPPVAFHPNKQENIYNCANEIDVFECLSQNGYSESDTLIFLTSEIPPLYIEEIDDSISQNEILGFFDHIGLIDSSLVFQGFNESIISYSALYETRKFQSVQYFYDEYTNDFIYLHGHPDGVTDSGEFNCPQNKLCTLNEQVVSEQVEDRFQFKYMFYTFSTGFDNYYFYDLLDIADPVRTNIRDGNWNPIMGGFGSMASETVNFYILTPEDIINLYLEMIN